jgi:hypothetical protein
MSNLLDSSPAKGMNRMAHTKGGVRTTQRTLLWFFDTPLSKVLVEKCSDRRNLKSEEMPHQLEFSGHRFLSIS